MRASLLGLLAVLAMSSMANGASAYGGAHGWVVVPSPNGPGAASMLRALTDVPGTRQLWAVGTTLPRSGNADHARALIEKGGPHGWTVEPTTSPRGSRLDAVAAVSPDSAFAVGYRWNHYEEHQPLAMVWDGSTWSVTSVPSPSRTRNVALGSVAALSPTDVWALGSIAQPGSFPPSYLSMLVHWDGTTWSRVAVPVTPGATETSLGQLRVLPGQAGMVAVGTATIGGSPMSVVDVYQDGSWTVNVEPPLQAPVLGGIAPASASDVWQVGVHTVPIGHHGGGTGAAYAAEWTPSGWVEHLLPLPHDSSGTELSAASVVPGQDTVWAVGDNTPKLGATDNPLAEVWNGTAWRITSTPVTPPFGVLTGVVAFSRMDVWAVGWSGNNTLVLHHQ